MSRWPNCESVIRKLFLASLLVSARQITAAGRATLGLIAGFSSRACHHPLCGALIIPPTQSMASSSAAGRKRSAAAGDSLRAKGSGGTSGCAAWEEGTRTLLRGKDGTRPFRTGKGRLPSRKDETEAERPYISQDPLLGGTTPRAAGGSVGGGAAVAAVNRCDSRSGWWRTC